jgi:hypothetical protein
VGVAVITAAGVEAGAGAAGAGSMAGGTTGAGGGVVGAAGSETSPTFVMYGCTSAAFVGVHGVPQLAQKTFPAIMTLSFSSQSGHCRMPPSLYCIHYVTYKRKRKVSKCLFSR